MSNEVEILDDLHISETSLDWFGRYIGNLPCADCDFMTTEVVLNNDKTYRLITSYSGKAESKADTLKGNFVWESNIIILDGIKESSRPNIFKVEENQLKQLDMSGNEIKGELSSKYLLKKV